MRKTWDIPGGVHPPENKSQSLQQPLGEVGLPAELVLPLNQHIGAAAEPVVAVGDHVLAGQQIAAAIGLVSAPVHASTSGHIVAIEERPIPHPSGMQDLCIVLRPDGKDRWIELEPCENYTQLSHAALLEKIRAAGIAGMGGAGFPTAVKLNPRANYDIDTLIINGTECEPYITADDILMQTSPAEVIAGTRLLAYLLNQPKQVLIGIEDNKPDAIAALERAVAELNDDDCRIEICTFPTKYPSGGEKQLIQILTGREVPSGELPAAVGVISQNVGTAVAAWRAVRYGEPLLSRITTVVGTALATQRNVRVRLGTPIEHVLTQHGFDPQRCPRLVMGGPMMGFTLPSAQVPVIKTTNCILAPSREELPPPPPAQACIRCGLCAEACPASLLPQQLYWYARAEDYERLTAHSLTDCIECGACAYVCPSNIPLVQYYRAAKGTIRQMEIEKEKSDRSRQRFEFRKERVARAEAEKEAKREARKKAAAVAKKKLAAAQAGAQQDSRPSGKQQSGAQPHEGLAGDRQTGAQPDMVAAAMARVQEKQLAPQQQREKLQRAIASAESRLQKAQQRHVEASAEHQGKMQARVREAEVRLADARQKLAALDTATPAPAENADPVAAAIARAQAKMALSPTEKLQGNLTSLQKRLATAREKLAAAEAEGSDTAAALATGVAKLEEKIATVQTELNAAPAQVPGPAAATKTAATDAAAVAIEKAKTRAAAQADMSAEEKLQKQLDSLQHRLQKARLRLEQAEADNDAHIDALRSGVEKLEAKLAQTRAQLEDTASP
ncbi:electron transport complex subunit RsxC [Exilibacterium tricleocarpae]|uniref:Ion-translocating oxidoreductase complex subunit C n=1 Tax=Exilibacterium tricleocarpae TaxID=2591008 RepID=A0A545U5I6_9GAMM|nr:electron transport complex subunit RsxC [Exilibacterium tricleocarpae]TQV84731.1 electron transport complex subunit RsxC [Exilibacterium tricleocarpae]